MMHIVQIGCFQLVLLLFYNVCFSSGLTMEGVSLSEGRDHLRLQSDENAILECKFSLKEGSKVKVITWYHDDLMALMWDPPEPAQIGKGLSEGDAVLTRNDGNLEFTSVKMDLSGKFRCEVMTTEGKTYKSLDYQVLIVDLPEVPDNTKYTVENCTIKFSWSAPAVKPRPDLTCGVWSQEHGYVLTAVSWMATPYYNGSVAYSLDQEEFQILHKPLDAAIRCEMKITKVDDTEIVLMNKVYNFTEISERGCPPLEVGDGIDLKYDNERMTCHAELKSKDETAPVHAHVKCMDGYIPKYKDFVTSVDMICKESKWSVGGDLTWNHFDNIICELEPKLPEVPPESPKSSLRSGRAEETSSGVNNVVPWKFALVTSVLILLGLAWGLKSNFKKKDERYMT